MCDLHLQIPSNIVDMIRKVPQLMFNLPLSNNSVPFKHGTLFKFEFKFNYIACAFCKESDDEQLYLIKVFSTFFNSIIHLVYPPTSCIIDFSWDIKMSQEKLENMPMQIFRGKRGVLWDLRK